MTNTLFIGKVYHPFEELPSTNDWAVEMLAKSKPPEGTVVRADRQTAGRGQFGSHWLDDPGQNLLLSVILYPAWLRVRDQFYLSMAVALALHDAAGGPGSSIKWPNDLYLGNQKTAGILIQNTLGKEYLQSSVAGIGLNVNQLYFDSTLPNPTSLAAYFGHAFDLDLLMYRLFECLEYRYLQLKAGKLEEIKHDYETALFRINESSRFTKNSDGSTFEGTIRGVAEHGHLRVEIGGGEMALFDLKEIRIML